MRAPMSTDEMRAYRVSPEAFWEAGRFVDGYDRQALACRHGGWRAVPSWGSQGWDLGSWPLVTIYMKEQDGRFFLAENVEGDVTVYAFDTEKERNAACDGLAFFHWEYAKAEWVADIATAADMPPRLRGPFSWGRVEEAS